MLNELLACPFCGAEAMMDKVRRANEDGTFTIASTKPDHEFKLEYHVTCTNCGCAPGNWMKTKKGAANQWNRRAG